MNSFDQVMCEIDRLDLSALTEKPGRFGAAAAEYLPDILTAAGK